LVTIHIMYCSIVFYLQLYWLNPFFQHFLHDTLLWKVYINIPFDFVSNEYHVHHFYQCCNCCFHVYFVSWLCNGLKIDLLPNNPINIVIVVTNMIVEWGWHTWSWCIYLLLLATSFISHCNCQSSKIYHQKYSWSLAK
jgi:hypothetical protein